MTLRYVDPRKRRGRFYFALARLSTTRIGAWVSFRLSWKLDPLLLKLTRGRYSTAWPLPVGLLETRGARTGRSRRNATLYFHDGGRVTIVASKRGWPEHPGWYHNIRRHPDVVYGGRPFRAEIVTDERERRRLWALADRIFPGYARYREEAAKVGRTIPIVQLVPTDRHA